jgi:eukaryotic-like serine/threonine-protein kinase
MNEAPDRGPTRVVGRYALYHEIAAGGMATVHVGRLLGPVGFARTVAIKRLHPQFAKDPEFVSMFLDEARLAARIQHPNVVATIDVVATDGELFLIMDYVRGETLSRLVRNARKEGRAVPPRIAAAIVCGALHGLHAAHEAKDERGELLGLVHRDVSPQNILVGADGVARVLDFGIAKAAGRMQVTRDGQIKGKLAYMPPEQLQGGRLTRTVDVYASAVVMWEALTGERLFKGDSEGETLAKIVEGRVPRASSVAHGISEAYDVVLERALSRDPTKRHQTARELALALERCDGIASPTDVGEWVEVTAGASLTNRERQVAYIESNSARLPAPPPDSDSDVSTSARRPPKIDQTLVGVGPPSSRGGATEIMSARHDPEVSESRVTATRSLTSYVLPITRAVPIALGVAVTLGIIVLVVVLRAVRADAPETATPTPTVASSPAGAASVPAPEPSAEPPTTTAPTTSASAPEVGSTRGPDATPTTTPTAKTTPRPTPTKVAPKPTATKPGCDPPYTVDASGRRHYKLQCM